MQWRSQVFREGRTKAVGNITKMVPKAPAGQQQKQKSQKAQQYQQHQQRVSLPAGCGSASREWVPQQRMGMPAEGGSAVATVLVLMFIVSSLLPLDISNVIHCATNRTWGLQKSVSSRNTTAIV